jgi:carbon monoxide dehydrogenase subunit G
MDISSSYTLNAPREQVWDALLDPDLLKRAIPGCESLEPTGDNQYAMRLNVDVAGVKGAYQGTMRVLDAQKPESYRVVVDGAGARGILHSDGVLRLTANDAGTTDIHYTGQAQLGGPVASIGAQVASGAASMLLKRYFGRIASLMPAAPVVAPVAEVDPVAPVAPPVAASAVPEAPAPSVEAAPAEPPPTSVPADIPPAVADAAPTETFTIPTPASAVPGLYAPPPPAASAAPVAPATPPPAPAGSSTPARTPLSVSGHESQRSSAGYIGVIFAILAVVVVVIVVLVVVGAFR